MKDMKNIKGMYAILAHQIIGSCIEVHKELGPGLLESTYQKCLSRELQLRNIPFQTEAPIAVKYKTIRIDCGYRLDFVVDDKIILELKSIDSLQGIHQAQLLTYMKLARIKQGFLINFNVPILKQGLKSFLL